MMKIYATNRHDLYSLRHESIRQDIQVERRSEEQKLDRLKKLLQAKVRTESGAGTVRAA
jgi:hypothetical protein